MGEIAARRIGDNRLEYWQGYRVLYSVNVCKGVMSLKTSKGMLIAFRIPDSLSPCEIGEGHQPDKMVDQVFRDHLYDFLEMEPIQKASALSDFIECLQKADFETPTGAKSEFRLREYAIKMFEEWPDLRLGLRSDVELELEKEEGQYIILMNYLEEPKAGKAKSTTDKWAGAEIRHLSWEWLKGQRRYVLLTSAGDLEAYWNERTGLCTLRECDPPVRNYTRERLAGKTDVVEG